MKTNLENKSSRDAKIDARISSDLKRALSTIAMLRDMELSDIIREALREKVARVQAQHTAMMAA